MAVDLFKSWKLAANAMDQATKVPKNTATSTQQPTQFGANTNTAPSTPQQGTPEWYAYQLGRAQSAYKTDYANRPDLQAGAHAEADRLRAEAAARGYNLDTFGQRNQHGVDYTGYFNQYSNGAPAGAYDPTKAGQVVRSPSSSAPQTPQMTNSDLLFKMFIDSLNGIGQQQQQQFDQLAKQMAEQQATQQKTQLEGLLNQAGTNLESTLRGINNSTEDAKSALEDSSFKEFLNAQQAMANRGLSGSGLANDQDTRLLLAKQKDLAGLFRDASTRSWQARQTYNDTATNIGKQIANINPDLMSQQALQQIVNNANTNTGQRSELLLKALSELMGYDYATVKDQLNYKTEQDKLNLERDKFRSDVWFDQNGTWKDQAANQIEIGKLGLEQQRLLAQVKQWSQTNALSADRNSLGWAQLSQKASYDSAMIQRFATAATNDLAKTTLSGLNNQLETITSQIKGYLDNGTAVPSTLTNAYNAVMNQVSRVLGTGGVDLSRVDLGSSPSSSNPLDQLQDYLNGGK